MIIPIAQTFDIYPEDGKHQFARTGALSIIHLKKAGAQGVLLGHSEVHENPEEVNKKLNTAWEGELRYEIVLLGEQWEDLGKPWSELHEEQKNHAKTVVKEKLIRILDGIDEHIVSDAVISYEPGWGVRGSGKSDVPPPQAEQIQAMAAMMRTCIQEKYSAELAQRIRIIYGGSMSPERAQELMLLADIDGFILGSAGTTTAWVKEITHAIHNNKKQRTSVLALNWKAYNLGESYEKFLEVIKPFEQEIDFYVAPPATDLAKLAQLL